MMMYWSREKELSLRDRSLLTVTALITKGSFEQLPYHMQTAKNNDITKMKLRKLLLNWPFMLAGQMLDPHSTLLKSMGRLKD